MVPPKNLCSSFWWMKFLYVNNLLLCVAPVQRMGANHAGTTILTKFDHFWFHKTPTHCGGAQNTKTSVWCQSVCVRFTYCMVSACVQPLPHSPRHYHCRWIHMFHFYTDFAILPFGSWGAVVCDPLRMGFVPPRCVSTSPHMENVLKLHHGATIYN